jgi:uncharacterized protein YyaL (SSP411 family)
MSVETGNALASASSSYLRSAAHQPIQWHQWSAEAFDKAAAERKPILLDIGAVWCHWCHVMDRESYENPEIAAVINQNFIAIKVDRDERPDVDSRYQAAVQAISGTGGWPLTAFLTPDGKPFFGGTYFPPEDRWGRAGFGRVLRAIAEAYRDKQHEVLESANSVMAAISQAESFSGRGGGISPNIPAKMVESALAMFDATHGGFGTAPKFPHPSALDLAIDRLARSGKNGDKIRNLVVATLQKMAKGGVYDQLAGGFHRYSVDERWIVPHFEKMSYDNSELLKNYVHGYQAVGDPFFAHIGRDIIRWMDEWLTDRERGGFYASQDADYSLDDDGDYFTWTLDEARQVLTEAELQVAALHYDIGEAGEMHHNPAKNVLFVRASVSEISGRLGTPHAQVRELLDSARQKLYAARLKRPTPYVDKTVYVSWNALCISAYLEAARVLNLLPEVPEAVPVPDAQLEAARHFALRSLDRILAEGWSQEHGLRHVIAYSDPQSQPRDVRGLLDDYAFTVNACLDAYETTADLSYFHFAQRIADAMLARFYDETGGGFFDTPLPSFLPTASPILGALSARRKPFQDSPTPAGNSAAAIGLLRLHGYTNTNTEDAAAAESNPARYFDRAEQTLEVFAGVADQFGIFGATYGIATVLATTPHIQLVVVGSGPQADALYRAAIAPFMLNKAVLHLRDNEVVAQNLPPALAATIANLPDVGQPSGSGQDNAVAILCSNFTCQPPIRDAGELTRMLKEAITKK